MKVGNKTIFVGNDVRSQRHEEMQQEDKKQGKTVFAGNLNPQFDLIARKKQQARVQAMKIVSDAFAGESKIDDEMQQHRDKIVEYKEDMLQARTSIREIEDAREELRKAYGVTEEDEEQKQLRELENRLEGGACLPKEEWEGLTDYQKESLEMLEDEKYYKDTVKQSEQGIKTESAILEGTRLARLKSNPMGKAWEQADDVKEAASKEIVGMLMDEAKEHVDKEMEERKEAAEKKAEEEKEQEEKLEKIRDRKEEQEEMNEAIADSVEEMLDVEDTQARVQDEIKKVMDQLKLLEEDIKGAAVDENV